MNRVLAILLVFVIPAVTQPDFARGITTTANHDLPRVSALHPRVFVRNDKSRIGKGLTVEQLRTRSHVPAYAPWRSDLTGDSPASAVERAARYLEEGRPAELEAVRQFLLDHSFSYATHDVEGFLAGGEMATAFDWIYPALSEADRASIMANIVKTADSSLEFMLHGEPDINHNYTYMALGSLGICGLVLKGEAEPYNRKAGEYLELTRQWIEGSGKILDTWKARQGAWAEGSHYTFHETLRNLVMLLQAYRSATDIDYFRRVERQYDGFLAMAGQFVVASTRPDLTFERIGDCSPNRTLPNLTVPLTLEALAAGLGDKSEAARLRSFSKEVCHAYGTRAVSPSFQWGMRIFWDPDASCSPSFRTYPLAMRQGSGTDERIVFRSGWEDDSTMITIVAGDHYTDHQHFDKGQFLIYHRGGLTVDGGAYDSLYVPNGHWTGYACRTLAHNCLLVYDPQESLPAGYSNDGGQVILRGLQHHGDWVTYRAHYKRERLDTGNVLAYDSDLKNGYSYVRCDLAGAYGEKVTDYERQYLYLPQADYLVVYDRVKTARPEFETRWLLHFQSQPRIDGVMPLVGMQTFPGARSISVQRNGQLQLENRSFHYDGILDVCTLLPEDGNITTVGGEGFEFFNAFEKVNYPVIRNANSAEPRESGTWRIEVTPSRAASEGRFLHALQIRHAGASPPAEVTLVKDMQRKLVGAHFRGSGENQVLLFSAHKKGGPVSLPVSYEVNSPAPARHLLVEMLSFERVRVEVNDRVLTGCKVGPTGVLTFHDQARGLRRITIKSVPRK